jgi:hypothetical protein
MHGLKGIEEPWQLYGVDSSAAASMTPSRREALDQNVSASAFTPAALKGHSGTLAQASYRAPRLPVATREEQVRDLG